jgi:hypothetical protein
VSSEVDDYVIYFFCKTNVVLLSPQIQITAGWILSNVAMLGSLDGVYSFYQPDADKTALESAFYNGLFRNVWAFGVCVTIFLCATGYGGEVPQFADREQHAVPHLQGTD